MSSFDAERFTVRLIAEALFYDEDYGALGNVSLIDTVEARERFVASFSPPDGKFVVEEATSWEDFSPDEEDEIGYLLALDSNVFSSHDSPDEAASALLQLARKHNLEPSITLLFEEDEIT
jgi:hypothetical protein